MTKHNLCKHPIYRIWSAMKQRCYNHKTISYKNYGKRGISVCAKWRNNFKPFYAWCIKNGWQENLQLDRINNNKGYTPQNCRFVTDEVNRNNRRITIKVSYNGETKLLKEWATELNFDYSSARKKIIDKQMPPNIAFSFKKNNVGKLINIDGQQKTLTEWCEFYNINFKRVWNRIHIHKWDIKNALTQPFYTRSKQII